MSRLLVCSLCYIFVVTSATALRAQSMAPAGVDPKQVCSNSNVVSKEALARTLVANTKNSDAVTAINRAPGLWQKIFIDDKFCPVPPASCLKNPDAPACTAAAKCTIAKSEAVQEAIGFFTALNTETNQPGAVYRESPGLYAASHGNVGDQITLFFSDTSDMANQIICTGAPAPTASQPFDPTKDPILTNIRIRGLSDDLNYDRAQLQFKGLTPATGSYTADTSSTHTFSTKATAAIGYAIQTFPQSLIVPYFSTYQSITDVKGKAGVDDPNSNVAGGVLLQHYFDYNGVAHIFSIKPQYLDDTATSARQASARAIYTPLMDLPFNLNTFHQFNELPGSPWVEVLLNLRSDTGSYLFRGNTPSISLTNQTYERAGTQFGMSVSTDGTNLPSWTLTAMETYLYGFSGYYRHLDQFLSTLTYNFPNSYFGLTVSYKSGRDEDTAVSARVWTIGLSAKY